MLKTKLFSNITGVEVFFLKNKEKMIGVGGILPNIVNYQAHNVDNRKNKGSYDRTCYGPYYASLIKTYKVFN